MRRYCYCFLLFLFTSATAHASLSDLFIGVDPGHGGSDPGAIALDQSLDEKTVNLQTALVLVKYLKLDGAKVIMSRQVDESMTSAGSGRTELTTRARFFNSQGVDYMISVHHNSYPPKPYINGVLAYIARGVCEGRSGQMSSYIVPSIAAANGLRTMGGANGPGCPGKPGIFQWDAVMVKETQMPAILAEMSFISNEEEVARLKDPAYIEQNGWALYAGFVEYLGRTPLPIQAIVDSGAGTPDEPAFEPVAPDLTWPGNQTQGHSPKNVELSWSPNNPTEQIDTFALSLYAVNAAEETEGAVVGNCDNKSIGQRLLYNTNECGELKPGHWYFWKLTIQFKDGQQSEARAWFKTGGLVLTLDDGSSVRDRIDFGEVQQNQRKVRKLQLKNTNQDEFQPHYTLSGIGFSATDNCPSVLELDESCIIDLNFNAAELGVATADLALYHGHASLGNVLAEVELTATGIVPPKPNVEPPTAAFTSVLHPEQALSVIFKAQGVNSGAQYDWLTSDGQSAQGTIAQLTFPTVGTYSVTLTVNDAERGSAQSVQTLQLANDWLCQEAECQLGRGQACTESMLREVLAMGGFLRINCGTNALVLSETLAIRQDTVIDGGGLTLSGDNKNRIIALQSYVSLGLRNMDFIDGKSNDEDSAGGAVFADSFTQLDISGCRFENNDGTAGIRSGGGGAIEVDSFSSVKISDSLFINNQGLSGGALNTLLTSVQIDNAGFLNNSTIAGIEHGAGQGGAIFLDGASDNLDDAGGQFSISGSSFTGNRGAGRGGAVMSFAYPPDQVRIHATSFNRNQVVVDNNKEAAGGALWHGNGALSLSASTFSENLARAQGGAVWLDGSHPAQITNVTFYRNQAVADSDSGHGGIGGAMTGEGNFTCRHCTFAENHAGQAGGAIYGNLKAKLTASILVANSAANDGERPLYYQTCAGALTDGGANLQYPAANNTDDKNGACVANIQVADAKLQAFGDYGGSTRTLNLAAGSPAIDNAGMDCPDTDQRGITRPQDGDKNGSAQCDSGAVEAGETLLQANGLGFDVDKDVSIPANAWFKTLMRTEDGREGNDLTISQNDTVTVAALIIPAAEHVGKTADMLTAVQYIPIGQSEPIWFMRTGTAWKTWDGDLKNLHASETKTSLQGREEIGIFYGEFRQLPGEFNIIVGYRVDNILVFNAGAPLHFVVK
jgi:predicted outer membrane repeat protein